jgi:hypothetical protein
VVAVNVTSDQTSKFKFFSDEILFGATKTFDWTQVEHVNYYECTTKILRKMDDVEQTNALRDVIAAVDSWKRACSRDSSNHGEKRSGEVHPDDSHDSNKRQNVSGLQCFGDTETLKQGTDEGLGDAVAPMSCRNEDAGYETPPSSPSSKIDSGTDTPLVSNLMKSKTPDALTPRAVSVAHHNTNSSTPSLPEFAGGGDDDDGSVAPVNSVLYPKEPGPLVTQPGLVSNERETSQNGKAFVPIRDTQACAKRLDMDRDLDKLKSNYESELEAIHKQYQSRIATLEAEYQDKDLKRAQALAQLSELREKDLKRAEAQLSALRVKLDNVIASLTLDSNLTGRLEGTLIPQSAETANTGSVRVRQHRLPASRRSSGASSSHDAGCDTLTFPSFPARALAPQPALASHIGIEEVDHQIEGRLDSGCVPTAHAKQINQPDDHSRKLGVGCTLQDYNDSGDYESLLGQPGIPAVEGVADCTTVGNEIDMEVRERGGNKEVLMRELGLLLCILNTRPTSGRKMLWKYVHEYCATQLRKVRTSLITRIVNENDCSCWSDPRFSVSQFFLLRSTGPKHARVLEQCLHEGVKPHGYWADVRKCLKEAVTQRENLEKREGKL